MVVTRMSRTPRFCPLFIKTGDDSYLEVSQMDEMEDMDKVMDLM